MNYLAHAFLSPDDPMWLMGNLWGDLIRPKDYPLIHQDIIHGVKLHKDIDAYTDKHPSVIAMFDLLRPSQKKYTPVVADVLMDFMLSKNWKNYRQESLEDFAQRHYQLVLDHLHQIPHRLHPRIERMVMNRWLESCHPEHIHSALAMLSKRASYENNIALVYEAYTVHATEMENLFLQFFEELIEMVSLRNAG